MNRKLLALILAVVTIIGLASCGGNKSPDETAIPTEPSEFLNYELIKTSDDVLSVSVRGVSEHTENITTIVIPSEINIDINEQDIAMSEPEDYIEKAFDGGTIYIDKELLPNNIDNITLPVTEISILAFAGIETLESVYIPDSVKEIGGDAFSDCSSLKSISIPEGVQFISCSMFNGCSSLVSVDLPQSTMAIEDSVFMGCDNLKKINYSGSEQDWSNILIFEDGNEQMEKAKIIYQEKE